MVTLDVISLMELREKNDVRTYVLNLGHIRDYIYEPLLEETDVYLTKGLDSSEFSWIALETALLNLLNDFTVLDNPPFKVEFTNVKTPLASYLKAIPKEAIDLAEECLEREFVNYLSEYKKTIISYVRVTHIADCVYKFSIFTPKEQ